MTTAAEPASLGGSVPPPSHRPTIGFLVDSLLDAYQQAIWESVVQEAAARDVNLLAFVAGRFGEGYRSLAHDLITPGAVDALVVVSSSVGCNLSTEALAQELAPFAGIPLVSIGMPIPGATSLVVDGAAGVRETVDHLVRVHGRRRFAFVRGPPRHAEAEARFQACREALERHGLALDPARIYVGDFDRSSGIRAVEYLLDRRGAGFDALVAASDYMAIYAMHELQRRGVRIPDDVAVAGFDDIRDAGCTEPLLTTVRQPLAALGREAVRRAVGLLRGERGPALTGYPAVFVARRSCGCLVSPEPDPMPAQTAAAAGPGAPDAGAVAGALEQLCPDLARRLGPTSARELAEPLVAAAARGPRPFLVAFDQLLAREGAEAFQAVDWYRTLRVALGLVPLAPPHGPAGLVEALWTSAARLVAARAEQAQARLRIRAQEQFEILQRIAEMGHSHEVELGAILRAELPKLGIRDFVLCRYRDARRREAELHFRLGPGQEPAPAPGFLPAAALVSGRPPDPRRAHAVLAIHSHDRAEHWGFAVCALGEVGPAGYETLALHVGTALKVSTLLERERRHAGELEVVVEERTRALHETQAQLIDAARHAGMAEVAVGVLHNVGNLLNSVCVCAEAIRAAAASPHLDGLDRATALLTAHADALGRFFEEDRRGALLPAYLGKLAEALRAEQAQVHGEAEALLEKTSLIRDTIRALQEYARGGDEAALRAPEDLAALIQAAVRIHQGQLEREGVRVELALAQVPPLLLQRPKVVHVLVNLIKNAVEAMRPTPAADRRLDVRLSWRGDGAEVRVTDTGEGIPPDVLPRVFGYGFTTKADGHGFGLHTCANHVAEMGGTIAAESEGPGRGATFTLFFPAAEA